MLASGSSSRIAPLDLQKVFSWGTVKSEEVAIPRRSVALLQSSKKLVRDQVASGKKKSESQVLAVFVSGDE